MNQPIELYKVTGPAFFYYAQSWDGIPYYYPVEQLSVEEEFPPEKELEFALGIVPHKIQMLQGYGIYIEQEDIWVFGITTEEVANVAKEWPDD
jgi:hypothetical protein